MFNMLAFPTGISRSSLVAFEGLSWFISVRLVIPWISGLMRFVLGLWVGRFIWICIIARSLFIGFGFKVDLEFLIGFFTLFIMKYRLSEYKLSLWHESWHESNYIKKKVSISLGAQLGCFPQVGFLSKHSHFLSQLNSWLLQFMNFFVKNRYF